MKDFLTIRLASLSDLKIYFKWVNEIEVRKNSFDTNEIELYKHKKWFLSRLNSKNSYLLILEKKNKPIGQIRFDIQDFKALIDYSIDAKHRGQGLGSELLKMGIKFIVNNPNVKKIKYFEAQVKVSNIASIKIFESIGFEKILISDLNKIIFKKSIKNQKNWN